MSASARPATAATATEASTFDYVVVGAGSAGCVLANRLSADPRVRVLLLEAGGVDRALEIKIPAAFAKLFGSAADWGYTTEAEGATPAQFWPRGKVLGGSSSLNAMMAVRGHHADYDAWEALGNPGWGHRDVLPWFKRLERRPGGDPAYRGKDGPLHITDPRSPNPLTRVFLTAANHVGIPLARDYNGEDQNGANFTQLTQNRGRRWSAADGYLRPALRRPNLVVETGALVSRVLLTAEPNQKTNGTPRASCADRPVSSHRAIGVSYLHQGSARSALARREVLLCGGAINSPQLLMLSGIGPAASLGSQELPVAVDLPGVGENLQDHPTFATTYACTQPVTLASAEGLVNLLRFLLLRRGPLTSNVAEAVAFVRTRPELPYPDVELLFAPTYFMNHGRDNPPGHGFTVGAMLLRPAGRGRITLTSPDPLAKPRIAAGYFSAGDDLERMVAGVHIARRVAQAPAFAPWRGSEVWPGADLVSDDALATFVRSRFQGLYHPVGTCRMGTDRQAVVDPQLRVHGVDGLRVVDASVMPTIPAGHTHLPTVMIAEKAAAMISGTA